MSNSHESDILELGADFRLDKRLWTISRFELQDALIKHAVSLGVEVKWNSRIDSINVATPSVKLQDGQVLTADLLIGADGKSSCESDEQNRIFDQVMEQASLRQ